MDDKQKHKALELAHKLDNKFSKEETESFIHKFSNLPFISDVKLLYSMITDEDYQVDKKTYAIIAGAIAYVVLPTDIIPDFIPGIGFVDDAFVVGMVIKSLKDEIENYKRFKNV
jgi:uncharacterized membrane protein YkvA (DUF1232 family)